MGAYAVCNVNGPISVRLDSAEGFDPDQARGWIDDARTDAEDDLGIAGEDMTEEEFAQALEAAGYSPVAYPDGNVRDGWVIWAPKEG